LDRGLQSFLEMIFPVELPDARPMLAHGLAEITVERKLKPEEEQILTSSLPPGVKFGPRGELGPQG
jgi:hypothetical protein